MTLACCERQSLRNAILQFRTRLYRRCIPSKNTDILKIDTAKLINILESEEQKFGVLKGYEATIRLKENISPSYSESHRIPIQLLPLINVKLKKMVKQGILEHVPKGGSNWASPIVVLRKADGDLRICGDYINWS